jgi:hypothetical protein
MLLSALSGSSHLGSVHRMASVFSGQRRCDLPIGLPGGWAKFTCAVAFGSEALSRARSAVGIRSAVAWPLLRRYLHLLCTRSCSIASLRLGCLLPLAPMGVVERIVGLSRHPQAVQEHTELPRHGHRRPFFLAFLPPREANFSPWRLRSESEPKGPRM